MKKSDVAEAILDSLISPNESDRNLEAANVVDGLFFIGRAMNRVAAALEAVAAAKGER